MDNKWKLWLTILILMGGIAYILIQLIPNFFDVGAYDVDNTASGALNFNDWALRFACCVITDFVLSACIVLVLFSL